MDKTRWIVFGAICVLLLGGLVVLGGRNKTDVSQVNANSILSAQSDTPGDNVFGNKNAKVTVYEYGDFQCPSCGGAYPNLKTLSEKYKDQIAFVFRNLPLTTIHPNALSAAAAAEAAAQQGKYWEMHNMLYDNQDNWSSASASDRNTIFEGYATSLGLNLDKYRTDLTGKAVTNKIARDRALAKKLNLSATPSIYVGDTKMNDDIISNLVQGDGSKFTDLVNDRLKAAGVALPQ